MAAITIITPSLGASFDIWGGENNTALTTIKNGVNAVDKKGLPSYAPATTVNVYDPKFNAYNWKPSNTRLLRRGLGRAATGGLCEIVAAGDSSLTGCIGGSTYDRLRAWPLLARDELARHGMPTAGTGLVRTVDFNVIDARHVYTGTWVATNNNFVFTTANAAKDTFTTNLSGDRVTVNYYDSNDSSTFTVSVNGAVSGGGFATVVTSSAGWKQVTLPTAITAGQTVVVTKTAGASVSISAIAVWSSTGGVLINNVAMGGSKAVGVGRDRWADASDLTKPGQVWAKPTVSLTNPDAVIFAIGGNDKSNAVSDSDLAAAITIVRNRYASSDFILVATGQLQTSLVTAAVWEATVASFYALADTLDVPLIDQRARIGNYDTVVANGLNGDTPGHLKLEAQSDLGRAAGMLLAS